MWNNFSPTSAEDESIYRGFCTNSLFQITNNESIVNKSNPVVHAAVQNNKIVLAIDNSLFLLFDEKNVQECGFLSFGDKIECFAVSQSGDLIICALADGNIHGVHINGTLLFNLTIDNNDIAAGNNDATFIEINQLNNEYFLMCSSGRLYRLFNVDEKQLSESILLTNENDSLNQTLLNNVIIEKCFTQAAKPIRQRLNTFCVLPGSLNSEGILAISADDKCLHFETKDEQFKMTMPKGFLGFKLIYNLENLILALGYDGHLYEICPYTMLIFIVKNADYLIDNIVVIECNSNCIELLLVTRPNAMGMVAMKTVDFPSMKCNLDMPVTPNTWLINQSKASLNIYYLNGDCGDEQFVQKIEMRKISETQPSERLKKLIQKGLLDEAEEFAKQSGLSVQPIYHVRAKQLMLEIGSLEHSDLLQEKFDKLLALAKLIESAKFLLSLRVIEIGDRNTIKRLLEFLIETIKFDDYQKEYEEIKEQLFRLETFQLIDPHECNLEWQPFVYHPNMLKTVKSYLQKDISVACIIWKKHSSSIIPFIDVAQIHEILNQIPTSTTPFDVIQWLSNFVPCLLQTHPQSMSQLIDWSLQKTRSLQFSKMWPKIGLDFSNNLLTIFSNIEQLFTDTRRQYEMNIAKICSIITVLQDLSVLSESYNLTLTLDDYINDDIEDIAFRILQRVNLDSLRSMVINFMYPIFVEKGLSPVPSIIRYIKFLVTNRRNISFWQERAVASIELLYNEQNKLECVLLILKAAPVPWTAVLNPIIKYRLSSHPLAAAICTEYELQTIKIIKIKYGWSTDVDKDNSLMKLACRVIKMNLPEMIEDIKKLVKTDPSQSSRINIFCAYELARKGDIESSMHFIDSLDDVTECRDCCLKLLNMISDSFDNNTEHFSDFLKFINEKIDENNKVIVEHLNKVQVLQQQFHLLDCNIGDLNNIPKRNEHLYEGIVVISNSIKNEKPNELVQKLYNKIMLLTKTLNFCGLYGIISLLKHLNSVHLSCSISKFVLELHSPDQNNYKMYMELAVLLVLQQIDAFETDTIDHANSMSFPIAYNLLQGISNLDRSIFLEVEEFLGIFRIGFNAYGISEISKYLKNSNNSELNEKIYEHLGKHFHEDGIKFERKKSRESMSIFEQVTTVSNEIAKPQGNSASITKCLSMAIKLLFTMQLDTPMFAKFQHQFEEYFVYSEDTKMDFYASLEHLIKIKKHSAAFCIVQYMVRYQANVIVIPESFVCTLHKKILKYALMQKDVGNYIDLLSILCSDPKPEQCLHYLNNELKSGSMKINYLTLKEIYNYFGDVKMENLKSAESRINYFYYSELCKIDASLKTRLNIDILTMDQLLKELGNKILDINLLKRMSVDFMRDYEEIIVSQIITILSQQELDFSVKIDAFGKEEIVVKTRVPDIRALCDPYIKELTGNELLASKLIEFTATINFYFYELYLCAIDILIHIDALPAEMRVWKSILLFLKHKMTTKRLNRIGPIETDCWLKSQLEFGVLPKIAKYRFPFKLLVQEPLKNLLDEEVSVENCDKWFPLIKLHCAMKETISDIYVSQDYFCMSAVKNSIVEYKNNSESEVWNLQPINNAFLQSVLRLVKHMNDLAKKLFILYFVTGQAPEGADQVEAAYECYEFATSHKSEFVQNKKTNDIVMKIERKYPIYKTQHLLHLYGLADDKLFQLVENPKELINALYSHEYILKPQKLDINKIAQEIAELHSLNFTEIQMNLLKKWLIANMDSEAADLDETYLEDLNTTMTNDEEQNCEEFVTRARYILCSWAEEKSTQFLISQIYPVDGSKNTSKQLQAFECFMKLMNDSNPYMNVVNQDEYIILKCVHSLKQIGYTFSIDKFKDYDKLVILKKVWESHATNPKALEVMVNICIGFNVYEPKIWNGVLKQMVSLNMTKQLSALVLLLPTKKSLVFIDGMVAAWECVVRAPFINANKTKSYEQEMHLSKSLFLLQSCPVSSKINLIELAEMCVRLHREHMAAICIPFGNSEQKSSIIKMVLARATDKKELKKQIIELEEFGIYPFITKSSISSLEL